MTKHEDELILENTPEGATYYSPDESAYFRFNFGMYEYYSQDFKWFRPDIKRPAVLRSLADIKELVELRKKNADLKK